MATRKYEGKKIETHAVQNTWDALTVEEPLQININGKPFTVSMRTPGNDTYLVRGILHSEGIINDSGFLPEIIVEQENKDGILAVVTCTIPEEKLGDGYSNSRSLLSVSSCGI